MAAGLDYRGAFALTGVVLSAALTLLLYYAALRATRARAASALAPLFFLLSGGVGFVFAFEDWRAGGLGLWDFFNNLPRSYANDWQHDLHWTNVVADTMLVAWRRLADVPGGAGRRCPRSSRSAACPALGASEDAAARRQLDRWDRTRPDPNECHPQRSRTRTVVPLA